MKLFSVLTFFILLFSCGRQTDPVFITYEDSVLVVRHRAWQDVIPPKGSSALIDVYRTKDSVKGIWFVTIIQPLHLPPKDTIGGDVIEERIKKFPLIDVDSTGRVINITGNKDVHVTIKQ